ncbi:MAG: hypothetical protein D8M58_04170 [Calditrichaeota bacterium]|nr:MAG: hypothetical protein DWQ03_02905 [Calditrichota bacterium]MBL1204565.1 hypothetical protein [Calditrichota bacterium]NOG44394.1 hypothetical protein [Calditrichota bacterium]
MWSLIKSEISYLKTLLFVLMGLVPIIIYLGSAFDDIGNMPVLAVMFILIQNWGAMRTKERREFRFYLLPLSVVKIGIARLIILFTYGIIILSEYELLNRLFSVQTLSYKIPSLILFAIIIFGFSIYFIMRDLFLYSFRRIGLTAQRIITALVIAMVAINMLGIYMLIQSRQSDSVGMIGSIIDTLIQFNPFSGQYGALNFIITSILLALLTLVSYPKRQAYFE